MKKSDKQLQREVTEIRRFIDGDSRETAMKPLEAYDTEMDEVWCSCPNCYAGICWEHQAMYGFNYCRKCGQKLDWSDVK